MPPDCPFGSTRPVGTVPSAFKSMNEDMPPGSTAPPKALISCTFSRMLAVGLLDTAKTVRATPVCAAIATSILVSGKLIPLFLAGKGGLGTGLAGTNCANDANPFAG